MPQVPVDHSRIASKRPSTNVWKGVWLTAMASLLDRCAELKRELLEFSCNLVLTASAARCCGTTFRIDSSATRRN